MAFRHYTKLKEVANKYGCDSAGCTTNGALLDRVYESPIDVNVNVDNIKLNIVTPVEGHAYCGYSDILVLSADAKLLEFEGVVGHRLEDLTGEIAPVGARVMFCDIMSQFLINDVENPRKGNLMLAKVDKTYGPVGFLPEDIETIRTTLASGEVALNSLNSKVNLSITSING